MTNYKLLKSYIKTTKGGQEFKYEDWHIVSPNWSRNKFIAFIANMIKKDEEFKLLLK